MPSVNSIRSETIPLLGVTKKSKRIWVVLAVVVVVALVAYMIWRFTREGFQGDAPLDWDPKDEVMVVFHKMEGCPHCVDFQSTWDEVYKIAPGEVRSKKNKTCKMAVVGPHHPIEETSAPVDGFPTVRLYKTPKEFVEFTGQRTPEKVMEFIMKNA